MEDDVLDSEEDDSFLVSEEKVSLFFSTFPLVIVSILSLFSTVMIFSVPGGSFPPAPSSGTSLGTLIARIPLLS